MTTDFGPDPAVVASDQAPSGLAPIGLPSGVEVLHDRVGAFGAVIAGIRFCCARDARMLREILLKASRSSVGERFDTLNAWCAEIDSAITRAATERWIGWESVHAPDAIAIETREGGDVQQAPSRSDESADPKGIAQ